VTGFRAGISLLVGVIVGAAVAVLGAAEYAPAAGWDGAALTLLVWTWLTIWPMGAHATETHATREDPTRPLSDVILLVAAVASLAAVVFLLVQASSAKGSEKDIIAAVGVVTVALSWLLVHTIFTLRYAMLYYLGHPGGISFNQSTAPRYSDFAYLAFTLGMTFQVSDTDLQTTDIRSTALRHALLSYLFGAVIVATMINLVAGLGS
jgi:uncharacterized membrane protein